MIAARELLRRYPPLAQFGPVKQVSSWRQQRSDRAHPRRMAAWFCDVPDLHTRVFVSNLELPEAPELCVATTILVTLLDGAGQVITERRLGLARNGMVRAELAELLPPERRNNVRSGQVRIDFAGAELGSSRAYLQWYNARSLAASHEKFGFGLGLGAPGEGGCWYVPVVQYTPSHQSHLAMANLDGARYASEVVLRAANGRARTASVELTPYGSQFSALSELFEDPGRFLDGQRGVLWLTNNTQPAMHYHFLANTERGTWRAQHL